MAKAGVDPTVMKPLYRNWLTAFVAAMNPEFVCRQTQDTATGDAVNRWEIQRK